MTPGVGGGRPGDAATATPEAARREARDRFPREHARTRRFTLGRARNVAVAADGRRVAFLRSSHGEDPSNALWVLDLDGGGERLVVDPATLAVDATLPPAERARRERMRETGGGIVAFAPDRALRRAAFALGGALYVADLDGGGTVEIPTVGAAFDPRLDPGGRHVAWVVDGELHVADAGGGQPRRVAGGDGAAWGVAEFVAAEEMGRARGFWWSPDGGRLAVARVDDSRVGRWHIADPARPELPPQVVAYPAAGTDNAEVTLWVVDLDGGMVGVDWDRDAFPYLAAVRWGEHGPLTLLVQSRDQRRTAVLAADPDRGTTTVVREDTDPAWVELVDGVPAWLPGGRLVHTLDDADTRRLAVDGEAVTPPGMQVRRVLHATGDAVLVGASYDPTEVHVARVSPGGEVEWLTSQAGVHGAVAAGGTVVVSSQTMEIDDARLEVRRGGAVAAVVASRAATPSLRPRVRFLELGGRGLRGALLLPGGEVGEALPVLMDPYGGPHAQRVLRSATAHLTSQWFAEHGFAVLVVDGRGTPGRGPRWEREIHLDLADVVLEDQIDGLAAAAEAEPRLDLGRVGIRGWSFGGYLAALAVLRRPDVFRAAVAGAPVTDWALYDTHYTERYLGHPAENPDVYRRASLLGDAAALERPLLLIHGMADDNVVAAHSLSLSQALLEAGRAHNFLPLSGITHMTPQEVVAENLLRLQLDFLTGALGL